MRNPNSSHPYRIPAILALMAIAAILAFTTVMTVSAQSNDRDWKQSPIGLNVTAGDAAGELDITWDAHPQTSKTLSDYRVTWTPDGESFKTNDHTEWYAYPTTNQVSVTGLDAGETYKVRVRARYDNNKKSRWSDVVSGQTGVTTNTPATGQPTISRHGRGPRNAHRGNFRHLRQQRPHERRIQPPVGPQRQWLR